jgi:hypothetical protein
MNRKLMGPPRGNTLRGRIPHSYIMSTEDRRQKWADRTRNKRKKIFTAREVAAQEAAAQAGFEIPRNIGFTTTPPGTFEEVDDVIAASREIIARGLPEKTGKRKTQLRVDLLDLESLQLDSPFLRFALRQDILAAVANYLGVAPLLTQVDVWCSVHQSGDLGNSQLFHCDWTDMAQVKIFVFCDDVHEESGPFAIMDATTSKKVRDTLGYSLNSAHNKLQDEEVYSVPGAREALRVMTGPTGTSIFADTSRCFHYGSRVVEGGKPRIMALFQYVTPASFSLPSNYKEALPFLNLSNENMTLLQRLAVGADG